MGERERESCLCCRCPHVCVGVKGGLENNIAFLVKE